MAHQDPVDGFRWRSREVTRIEGFSDAVFGFATTLLIISLEVPKTSTELLLAMRGFSAFVVTFVILAGIWYSQYTFFRRYGLEDRVTVVLNLVLLFTVLFFVYPLKFLFGVMVVDPTLNHLMVETAHGLEKAVLPEHRALIFLIFGAGFAAVFAVFLLLYRHAYAKADELGLNEFERYETQHSIRRLWTSVSVGGMYFLIGGMNALPQKTPGQKRAVEIVGLVIMVLFVLVVIRMVRLRGERRARKREWLAKSGPDAPPPQNQPVQK